LSYSAAVLAAFPLKSEAVTVLKSQYPGLPSPSKPGSYEVLLKEIGCKPEGVPPKDEGRKS